MRTATNRRVRPLTGRRCALLLTSAALAAAFGVGLGTARTPAARERAAPLVHRRAVAIDRPTTRLRRSRLADAPITWIGGPTKASTGETVTVYVSSSLAGDAWTPQAWADFIAGLEHGPELALLTAYVATFDEMQAICGPDALGCYGADRLLTIGAPAYGITPQEVVRHEYGHHIAAHRMNPPWLALDWGPKNWASAVGVCGRAKDGTAYPGDESLHYTLNPGEAWAETYRVMEERRAGAPTSSWNIVDGSFYPNDADFAAAERDVLQPWETSHALVFTRTFTRKGKRVWNVPLATPLDGSVQLDVSLPRGGLYAATLLGPDRRTVVADALWASATSKRIATTICGERTLDLRVTERGAFGRVRVSATLP